MLVSGSIDRTVRLWDVATSTHLRLLSVHKEAITAIAISHDDKLVASSSQSGVTHLSNVADGKTIAEFAGPKWGATSLSFSRDGKRLFMGSSASRELLAYEVAGGKAAIRLNLDDDGQVKGFGNGGDLAIVDQEDGARLRLWDLTKQRPAASLTIGNPRGKGENRRESVICVAANFSPDGRLLASSQVSRFWSDGGYWGAAQLRLWERVSGESIRTLGPVTTKLLAFSPSGRLLASTGAGKSDRVSIGFGSGVDVWDTLTGEKAGTLPVTPKCVAFSPDGAHVATGGRDHCILIWEAPKVKRRMLAKAPALAERNAWWGALDGDAPAAYKVIGQMIDAPEHALALLRERVRPVPPIDATAVGKLIDQLSSDEFPERESAERALEKMGHDVAHHLKRALQDKADLEMRVRLKRLLKKLDKTPIDVKRHLRAVLALEWIGTPAARVLLRNLADGAPSARLTVEARAALQRLER